MTRGGTRLPMAGGELPLPSAPIFQRVAIVGLGCVGASLALALRSAWPGALVIGIGAHAELETAIRLHAIDVGADDLEIAADADVVVLCGSAAENARALPYLADAIRGEAVILSLGGGTEPRSAAAAALPSRLPLVVGVPRLDPPAGHVEAARADLFRGRRWTISPGAAPEAAVERVRGLVRAVGGEPDAGTLPPPVRPSRAAE